MSGDRYCLLCMEEKLAIASYKNPRELLNPRFEILNACWYKKKPDFLAVATIIIKYRLMVGRLVGWLGFMAYQPL